MTKFLKIVDIEGDVRYINTDCIVSIIPGNRKSFRDSGAQITFNDGHETKAWFTAPGEATSTVVALLGIEEY